MMIVKSRNKSPWVMVAVTLMLLACVAIGVQWWLQVRESTPNVSLSSTEEAQHHVSPIPVSVDRSVPVNAVNLGYRW